MFPFEINKCKLFKVFATNFSMHWWFFWPAIIITNGGFIFLCFLLLFLIGIICKKELYLIVNLLICSVILKHEDKLMYVYFSLWITTKYHYLFYCSECSSLGHWEHVHVGFCGLSSFRSTFFLSGTTRCSKIISCCSCPDLESATSSRSPGSFHWRTVFWNQDLGAGCTSATGVPMIERHFFFSSKNVCLCSHLP